MIDDFKGLLTRDELDFEQRKFRGKLAAKSYQYSRQLDGLVRTRLIMFFCVPLVLYRVLSNYLFHDFFDMSFFIERLVFATVIAVGALLFNKVRIVAIIIAAIPLAIISVVHLMQIDDSGIRIVGFMLATTIAVLVGIFHHQKSRSLRRYLERELPEHHLLD